MFQNSKRKFFALLVLFSANTFSKEFKNYGDIKIEAEIVAFNEIENQLLLKKNVSVGFGNFIIEGDSALMSYEEKKLTIEGSPASINSEKDDVNGSAQRFIIYPNLSIKMYGDAKIFEGKKSIYSEQITYQIKLND